MLRLLATPNTTATRPSREKDMVPPAGTKKKRITATRDRRQGRNTRCGVWVRSSGTSPNRPRCLGRARVGGRRACFATEQINPVARQEFRKELWKTWPVADGGPELQRVVSAEQLRKSRIPFIYAFRFSSANSAVKSFCF